jgi:chaperonin GroEL
MQTIKPKAPFKISIPSGALLEKHKLETVAHCAMMVGATLGPGGHPVLIEREEIGLPPTITKDGVTVFKALGFRNAIDQAILETVRDASVRTAAEAGDGTTTATILADSFTHYTAEYCKNNPKVPTIKVIKTIQDCFKNKLEPLINQYSIKCSLESEESRKILYSVAKLSANGDVELAKAVMDCFDICGDEGNVTITESCGASGCSTEKIEGFPIAMGYEESIPKYYPIFITDPATQKIVAEKPIFILYFGRITDVKTIIPVMEMLQAGLEGHYIVPFNIILVANGFSEAVLAQLAHTKAMPGQINIFPLVVPQSPLINGQRNFLDDMAAVTGATIFDPLNHPLETCVMDNTTGATDIGNLCFIEEEKGSYWDTVKDGVTSYECGRYRSTVVGFCNPEFLQERIDIVKKQAEASESQLERQMIDERVARLTGGIAKLNVTGSSNGELKERRDRAEDAVCAVRGALKYGALIGGGWMLAKLIDSLDKDDKIEQEVVSAALWQPILTLYTNAGLPVDKIGEDFKFSKKIKLEKVMVRDISKDEMVNAFEGGILDSLPAVKEALKNSISIATILGTVGGCIVQPRDLEVDRTESREYNEFTRTADWNPADERG